MARVFSGASPFLTGGRLELQADSSSARLGQVDRVSLPVAHGPSIRRAAASRALAGPALRAAGPALAQGLDSGDRVRADLANGQAAPAAQFRPQARLRVHNVQQDARAAGTSSIRRPRKAR